MRQYLRDGKVRQRRSKSRDERTQRLVNRMAALLHDLEKHGRGPHFVRRSGAEQVPDLHRIARLDATHAISALDDGAIGRDESDHHSWNLALGHSRDDFRVERGKVLRGCANWHQYEEGNDKDDLRYFHGSG